MADFGGEVTNFGNRLVQARKQAEDQDAVSKALTDDTIEFSKMETEEQNAGAGPVNRGWSVRGEEPISRSDNLRKRMTDRYNAQAKLMPSEEARRKYQQVSENQIAETYARSLKWEARKKAEGYLDGVWERGNKLALQQLQAPSIDSTIASLDVLKTDIDGNTGTVLPADAAPDVYNKLGSNVVKNYFTGLADSSVEMSPEKRMAVLAQGREMLKNPPKEFAQFLDATDIQALERKLDSAEREGKQHDAYREQLEKKALEESRERTQNALLNDIYNGKGSIKNILRSNLDPDKKQQMIGILERRLKEPKVASDENLRSVVSRIHADAEDPAAITSEAQIKAEYISGKLTWEQMQRAEREFQDRLTLPGQVQAEMKKRMFREVDALYSRADPEMSQAMSAKFTSYALQELEEAQKRGESTRELLDANSPKYLGRRAQTFLRDPKEVFKGTVNKLKARAAAKKGEIVVPDGRVLMINPAGQMGHVPAAKVEEKKKQGFKLANEEKPTKAAEKPKKPGFWEDVGKTIESLRPGISLLEKNGESQGFAFANPFENEKKGGRSPQSVGKPVSIEEQVDEIEKEIEIQSSNLADARDAGKPTAKFEKRIEQLEQMREEIDPTVTATEEELMAKPRGTDEEEAKIRNDLGTVQSKNRDAKRDRRKK